MINFRGRADYYNLPFWDIFFAQKSDAEAFASDVDALGLEADVFLNDSGKTGVTVVALPEDAQAFRDLASDWSFPEVNRYVADTTLDHREFYLGAFG